MASSDIYDLVVVGAGTSGIVSARFYLDVHPDAKVVLIERDNAVGGVWSSGQSFLPPFADMMLKYVAQNEFTLASSRREAHGWAASQTCR